MVVTEPNDAPAEGLNSTPRDCISGPDPADQFLRSLGDADRAEVLRDTPAIHTDGDSINKSRTMEQFSKCAQFVGNTIKIRCI